jgi:hypothetical protein
LSFRGEPWRRALEAEEEAEETSGFGKDRLFVLVAGEYAIFSDWVTEASSCKSIPIEAGTATMLKKFGSRRPRQAILLPLSDLFRAA